MLEKIKYLDVKGWATEKSKFIVTSDNGVIYFYKNGINILSEDDIDNNYTIEDILYFFNIENEKVVKVYNAQDYDKLVKNLSLLLHNSNF